MSGPTLSALRPRVTLGFPWVRGDEIPGRRDNSIVMACELRVPGHSYDTEGGYHAGVSIHYRAPHESCFTCRAPHRVSSCRHTRGGFQVYVGGSGGASFDLDELDDAVAYAEEALRSRVRRGVTEALAKAEMWKGLLAQIGEQA